MFDTVRENYTYKSIMSTMCNNKSPIYRKSRHQHMHTILIWDEHTWTTATYDDKPNSTISTNAQNIRNTAIWWMRHLPNRKRTFLKRESGIPNLAAIDPFQFYSSLVWNYRGVEVINQGWWRRSWTGRGALWVLFSEPDIKIWSLGRGKSSKPKKKFLEKSMVEMHRKTMGNCEFWILLFNTLEMLTIQFITKVCIKLLSVVVHASHKFF